MTEAGSIGGLTQLLRGRPARDAFDIWVRDILIEEAWYRCDRGDHLLDFAETVGIVRESLIEATIECMRPILTFAPPSDGRPAHALNVALACRNGKATRAEADAAIGEAGGAYPGNDAASHHCREALRLMLTRPGVAVEYVAGAALERAEVSAVRAWRSAQEVLGEGRRARAASLAASADTIRGMVPLTWILEAAARLA